MKPVSASSHVELLENDVLQSFGDIEPVSLSSLPESVGLSRGRLEVSFRIVEQLAEAIQRTAAVTLWAARMKTESDLCAS